MMDPRRRDLDYQTWPLEKVDGDREHGWSLTFDRSMHFGCPKDSPIEPKVGMRATLFGKGFGFAVRGLMLDDTVVFYHTAEQEEAHHREQVEASNRKKQAEANAERTERNKKRLSLPDVFRQRLDGFEAANPNFCRDFEPYELFTCEQAVAFAEAIPDVEQLQAWAKLPWEQQRERVPQMSDGHSGNTFGAAVRLAWLYLTSPELVPQEHGAMCPLTGCKDYGCFAARTKATT